MNLLLKNTLLFSVDLLNSNIYNQKHNYYLLLIRLAQKETLKKETLKKETIKPETIKKETRKKKQKLKKNKCNDKIK